MRILLTAVVMLAAAVPASAQHTGHGAHAAAANHHVGGEFPEGWHGRVDRESQKLTDVQFMSMGESFHIISAAHAILWNPEHTATGQYRASATFRLSKAPERLEGFGLIVGGRDLAEPGQDYLYFLTRHDGSYMIRHRAGTEVHTLADWTQHAAVNRPGAASPASNELAIESRADVVRFLINGQVVQSFDRVPMLNTDGLVGLRVGHHVDVHVQDFAITPIAN